ncbi:hypothetical protein H8790_11655 [Oscillibacter hominis]|uniref:Uncharacterized protein n=1 Tax=Oscillibacter hominis TaxID=2763056 RepID=A0A7G9B3F4_9FIRM|nr:DUF5697 family protein [Oscillibacter hominis]QNL44085.1 hypothetical protein H8790_11655 [Oscillibacter hominis]
MLLSVQQRYILILLRQIKCLRRRQLYRLTKSHFPRSDGRELSEGAVDAMLRQLRHCTGDVILDGDLVHLMGVKPNERILEAIDVMLELTGGNAQDISIKQETPALLRFVLEGERPRLFTVADLDGMLPQALSSVQRQRSERIVWISESSCAPERLVLPPKQFFAARQNDGSHRFYSGDDS